MDKVYAHYDFLKWLTKKRFEDDTLADEAYSFAFEKLAQDDWRRVRACRRTASFRSYLGTVWCRLLEDFYIKKFGKITPPRWIQNLGGIWLELFELLCCHWLSVNDAVERIIDQGRHAWSAMELETASDEILARIPNCGRKVGPAFSIDACEESNMTHPLNSEIGMIPEEMVIEKERWIALQALGRFFFQGAEKTTWSGTESQKLAGLVTDIRRYLPLTEEEQLILNAHYVDGQAITDIGRCLGFNSNQIHGKFRRLMVKIKKTLPELLAPYMK